MLYLISTHQHGGAQIEFMKELRDEYVYLEHVRDVFSFDVSENVDKPLEVLVRRTDP